MTIDERIRNILLLEKMDQNLETAKILGLQDKTVILESKIKDDAISGTILENDRLLKE